ncbi:hypothetical protein NE237_004323 [Protea cynaroides]|uniref:Uncharacterized protein n=1 Tax=Protea cynaroides TaxID=273540 RepID=A0A9Q0KIP8_9MAGN|nr:hypothetical protein NE237_004323 [Protea cynaroides]
MFISLALEYWDEEIIYSIALAIERGDSGKVHGGIQIAMACVEDEFCNPVEIDSLLVSNSFSNHLSSSTTDGVDESDADEEHPVDCRAERRSTNREEELQEVKNRLDEEGELHQVEEKLRKAESDLKSIEERVQSATSDVNKAKERFQRQK